MDSRRIIISFSYDKTIKFWDLRQWDAIKSVDVGYKIYCADVNEKMIAVGLSNDCYPLAISDIDALQNYNEVLALIKMHLKNNLSEKRKVLL